MIEKEDLVMFRISFLQSKTLAKGCLLEYYTIGLNYEDGGKYGINIWRSGAGKQHVSNSNFKLWNLGDYLSRLPPLQGALAFFFRF